MAKKNFNETIKQIATEPGIFMTAAHVLLSIAAGGVAFGIALASFATTAGLKMAREAGLAEKFKNKRLRQIIGSINTPMRVAALGLTGLAALSFGQGLTLLGTAFALFASGNALFNTKFSQKVPLDKVLMAGGSCITAFIAGASILPWAPLIVGCGLSCYNLLKPSGDRNFMKPFLWAGLAQGLSGTLGLLSQEPSRFFPALGMMCVFAGYTMMEARVSNWFGKKNNGQASDRPHDQNTEPHRFQNNKGYTPAPSLESQPLETEVNLDSSFQQSAEDLKPDTSHPVKRNDQPEPPRPKG